MTPSVIVAGLVLLLFGRKVFWLFIALAGFLVGVELARSLLSERPEWIQLAVATGIGVLGALIAPLAQRFAFALAGFFSAGYVFLLVARSLGIAGDPTVPILAWGLVGAVFALLVTDWALIILSALMGAGTIVAAFDLGPGINAVTFALLAALGILVQGRFMAAVR